MPIAVTRPPTAALAQCALTHLEREPIDIARARTQHRGYEATLVRLGARIVTLPEEPDLPDAVFVEDVAVVLDEVGVILRPGVESRRGEEAGVAAVLSDYRPLVHVASPATVDGGDVMVVGRTIFVGRSSRSNVAGITQLQDLVRPYGYHVRPVGVHGCLHLKSACSHVGDGRVLANRHWIESEALENVTIIDVPPTEPRAANTLMVGETVVMAAGFPETADLLWQHGCVVETIDLSELQKAEAGGSCMSLIFEGSPDRGID